MKTIILLTSFIAITAFAQGNNSKNYICAGFTVSESTEGKISIESTGKATKEYKVSYAQKNFYNVITIQAFEVTPGVACTGSCPVKEQFTSLDTISGMSKTMIKMSSFDESVIDGGVNFHFTESLCSISE